MILSLVSKVAVCIESDIVYADVDKANEGNLSAANLDIITSMSVPVIMVPLIF